MITLKDIGLGFTLPGILPHGPSEPQWSPWYKLSPTRKSPEQKRQRRLILERRKQNVNRLRMAKA